MKWLLKGSTGPIKFKSERSVQKVMPTLFWDSEGIILVHFLEGSKTITGIYYVGVLRKFKAIFIKATYLNKKIQMKPLALIAILELVGFSF